MPLVDRFKFVTKGRWLTQICERYAKNKTNDLQLAFFNGDVSPKLSKFGAGNAAVTESNSTATIFSHAARCASTGV